MIKFNVLRRVGAALGLVGVSGAAMATTGSDAVTAITAAQTDSLLVVGAVTALAIAVWGGLYIKRKFFG